MIYNETKRYRPLTLCNAYIVWNLIYDGDVLTMTPNLKKAVSKFTEKQGKSGYRVSSGEHKFNRGMNRIGKLANRIRRKKARPEEVEEFNKLKKEMGVKLVTFDKFKKKWVIE